MNVSEYQLLYRIKKQWLAYLFIAPALAILIIMHIYSMVFTIYISMTNFGIGGLSSFYNPRFVGFQNYVRIFSINIHTTLILIGNSFLWASSILILLGLSLGLASILNQDIKGKWIYRTILLFPWAMPALISLLVWGNMWNFTFGIINSIISTFGFSPVNWIGHPTTAWIALYITNIWLLLPFYTIIFLAAMQAIPKDLYEAAEIDGASSFYKFRRITISYIKPTIAFIGMMGFFFIFNNFYPVYFITFGGPGISTQIFVTYIYDELYNYSAFATSAVYTVVNFVILVVIGYLAIKYLKLTKGWLS
jgi:arabinogalactan oligomer/maltooligosaccharide transport system permease protein